MSTYLHHSRGIPKLRYSIRVDREIRRVYLKPFNRIVVNTDNDETFLVTVGLCETASRLGRLKLVPYVGNWPRCALLWARLKEIVRHG